MKNIKIKNNIVRYKNYKFKIVSRKFNSGFTLIEMMIATALFSTLSLIIISAVLSVNSAHKKTSQIASIMNNMSFAMDDIVFNMRTGRDYECHGYFLSLSTPLPSFLYQENYPLLNNSNNCQDGSIVALNTVSGTVVYAIGLDYANDTNTGRIYKSYNGGIDFYAISPPEIVIDPSRSGFTVSGSATGDGKQPIVIIRLAGKIKYQRIETSFSVQSTVSQREIDS